MKFKIVHDTPGRIRLRCGGYYFDKNQEKSLEKTIFNNIGVNILVNTTIIIIGAKK